MNDPQTAGHHFDLDGVITDTAHLHFRPRQVAGEIGIAINEAFNDSLKGISRGESLQRILQYGGKAGEFTPEVCAQLAERKTDCMSILCAS